MRLKWRPPSVDGNSPVTDYEVSFSRKLVTKVRCILFIYTVEQLFIYTRVYGTEVLVNHGLTAAPSIYTIYLNIVSPCFFLSQVGRKTLVDVQAQGPFLTSRWFLLQPVAHSGTVIEGLKGDSEYIDLKVGI